MKRICGIAALVMLVFLPGCRKYDPVNERDRIDQETRTQRKYVNTFAWNVMNSYYLWRDEIQTQLDQWETWEDPIQKVADIRYKDASGKDIDRWTMVTDDYSSFQGDVSGHTRTLGMDFVLYYYDQSQKQVCAVVTYTYAGSPAETAGLKRGDLILTVNGREMMKDNYQQIVQDGFFGGGTVKLGLRSGKTVTLTAVDMYEDPVQTVTVLQNQAGRKVGYLHYTSFTLDSCDELTEVFRHFVEEGIDDLVLDLRYNGGGYVITGQVLGSMLAPLSAVEAGSVFTRQIVFVMPERRNHIPDEKSQEQGTFPTADPVFPDADSGKHDVFCQRDLQAVQIVQDLPAL